MKTSSPRFLLCLLASVAIAVCFAGCSRSENKSQKGQLPAFLSDEILGLEPPTPEDMAFAKAYRATWITPALPPQPTFTVDYQDSLFPEGSTLACALGVTDVQRENGVLMLTGMAGFSRSIPGDFEIEIEITTNMLSTIRAAGGMLSVVRLAFQVESFKRIETDSWGAFQAESFKRVGIESDSSENSSDRYLLRGKAVAIEPIPEAELNQK